MNNCLRDPVAYLNSFIDHEKALGEFHPSVHKLERFRALLALCGDPLKNKKIIHVAGSKGKGSTCSFLAHILRRAGTRTGLYTSPHFYSVHERIRILDQAALEPSGLCLYPDCISEEALQKTIESIAPFLEMMRRTDAHGMLTYYEAVTAVAFMYFSQQAVDCVILETGLGGRWDATNVVDSCLSCITPISLEHTQQLGSRIELIAEEKAAIIKESNTHVVLGPQKNSVEAICQRVAKERAAQVIQVGRQISYHVEGNDQGQQEIAIQGQLGCYEARVTLLGDHQAANASAAVALAELVLGNCPHLKENIEQGLLETFWPGRFEIISGRPVFILDSAHSPDAARVLAETFQQTFPGRKAHCVLGMSQDKDHERFCAYLLPIVSGVTVVQADHARAYDFSVQEIERYFPGRRIQKIKSVEQAIKKVCQSAGDNDMILVTGSIFLVAQVREVISKGYQIG